MGGGELPPPPMDDMGGGELPPPPVDDMGGMGDTGGELPPPPMDDDMGDDLPPPPMDDEDMGDEDMGDEEKDKKEGGPSFKIIQKLTGKLAQKIRKYNTKDEMDSNDVKYIINSILSALDVDVLDDDDIEEIINRLEGDYEEDEDLDDEDVDDMEDEDLPEPMDDMGDEDLPEPPEGGEMSEYHNAEVRETTSLGDAFKKAAQTEFGNMEVKETTSLADGINHAVQAEFGGEVFDELKNMPAVGGELDEYGMRGARKPRHTYGETNEFTHLKHGTFGESKVDKIISSYFKVSDSERIDKTKNHIRNLSENIVQERLALKFVEKHPKSKMLGKLTNGNLVFENKNIKYKITPGAEVI